MPRTFSRETRLAQRMDALGFTVQELSDTTGLNRWLLNDYLHARQPISARSMMKLTKALSCEPESLMEPRR